MSSTRQGQSGELLWPQKGVAPLFHLILTFPQNDLQLLWSNYGLSVLLRDTLVDGSQWGLEPRSLPPKAGVLSIAPSPTIYFLWFEAEMVNYIADDTLLKCGFNITWEDCWNPFKIISGDKCHSQTKTTSNGSYLQGLFTWSATKHSRVLYLKFLFVTFFFLLLCPLTQCPQMARRKLASKLFSNIICYS